MFTLILTSILPLAFMISKSTIISICMSIDGTNIFWLVIKLAVRNFLRLIFVTAVMVPVVTLMSSAGTSAPTLIIIIFVIVLASALATYTYMSAPMPTLAISPKPLICKVMNFNCVIITAPMLVTIQQAIGV